MKTITFTYPHSTGAYGCSEPGDNSGEYVRADVAAKLLHGCRIAFANMDHWGDNEPTDLAVREILKDAISDAEKSA